MCEFCKLNPGFDSDAIKNAMEYAADCHIGTNQKYDTHPYTIHLKMVYDFGCKFAHLLNAGEIDTALAACWTHDTIEDTRQTYNDVKKRCGFEIAEIVYALTNEKGRTREERANEKYYSGIRALETATFVNCSTAWQIFRTRWPTTNEWLKSIVTNFPTSSKCFITNVLNRCSMS